MDYHFSTIILFILFAFILRAVIVIYKIRKGTNKFSKIKHAGEVRTIVCIGSGGHTTEMLKLIENLDLSRYKPRHYIMAKNDVVSEQKILSFETRNQSTSDFRLIKIPRSRAVKQSYFTSIFSTLNSIVYCVPVVLKIKPDLILCNGPGTCVPVCLIGFMMRVLFLCRSRIIFIESICRVNTFSLTGQIMMYFADNIIVHWEELHKKYKRADYLGPLF